MRRTHTSPVAPPRSGFTLLELSVAAAVLAVLLATALKVMTATSNHARANERRLIALQTVQAVTEQIGNIPWDRLPTEAANPFPLPESTTAQLPGAELKVAVHDETAPPAKRITVELTWSANDADRAAPVRLTSWVFPETAPPSP